MKNTKKLALLCAVMLCGLSVMTGCTENKPSENVPAATQSAVTEAQPGATEAAQAAASGAVATPEITMAEPGADAVLVTVNGRSIARNEVDDIAGRLLSVYASYGMDTGSAEAVAALRQMAISTAVQMELMLQKGEEWGVSALTEAEQQELSAQNHAEWENVVSYYMQASGVTDASAQEEKDAARAAALTQLETMGYTEQILLDSAVKSAKLEKIQAEIVKDIEVTDEELTAAYAEQAKADEAAYKDDIYNYELNTRYMGKRSYYTPAGYRGVTQILLPVDEALMNDYQALSAKMEEQAEHTDTPDAAAAAAAEETATPVTEEQMNAARDAILAAVQPQVDEIRAKLAEGAAFAELIDQYNTDPGMNDPENRANGYSVHMDSVVYDPAFVKAAFSVKEIGQMSEPAVGTYGVYLVCYVRDVPSGAVPMDEVRSELTESVLAQRENEVFNSTMSAWIEAADIAYTEAGQAYVNR